MSPRTTTRTNAEAATPQLTASMSPRSSQILHNSNSNSNNTARRSTLRSASPSERRSSQQQYQLQHQQSRASLHQRLVGGRLVTGPDFDKYCERHGLCPLCGVQPTHDPAKFHRLLWKRKPWKPLTIIDDGNYVVYKGYCIQPTCYSLEQAKSLLGESDEHQHDELATENEPPAVEEEEPDQQQQQRRRNKSSRRSLSPMPQHRLGRTLDSVRRGITNAVSSSNVASASTTSNSNSSTTNNAANVTNSFNDSSGCLSLTMDDICSGSNCNSTGFRTAATAASTFADGNNSSGSLTIPPPSRHSNATTRRNTLVSQPSRHTLDLTGRQLDEYEIQVLIHSQIHGIKTLILDRCGLGDAGVVALVQWIVQYPPDSLKVLCLRWNQIGPIGAKALSQLLVDSATTTPNLRTLRLSHNRLGDNGASFIFQSLQYADQCAITEISMSSNNVGPRGAAIMATCLTEISSLVTLSLDHNRFGDEGVEALCNVLAVDPGACALESISFNQNEIGNDGATALGAWMTSSMTLQKISIRGNEIGDDGATALVCGLVSNGDTQKQKLLLHGLESNSVTDQSLIEQVQSWNKTVPPPTMTPPPPTRASRSTATHCMPSPISVAFPPPPDLMQMEMPSRGDCHRALPLPSASSSPMSSFDDAEGPTTDLLSEIPYESDQSRRNQNTASSFYQSASQMLDGMDDSLELHDFLKNSLHHEQVC